MQCRNIFSGRSHRGRAGTHLVVFAWPDFELGGALRRTWLTVSATVSFIPHCKLGSWSSSLGTAGVCGSWIVLRKGSPENSSSTSFTLLPMLAQHAQPTPVGAALIAVCGPTNHYHYKLTHPTEGSLQCRGIFSPASWEHWVAVHPHPPFARTRRWSHALSCTQPREAKYALGLQGCHSVLLVPG